MGGAMQVINVRISCAREAGVSKLALLLTNCLRAREVAAELVGEDVLLDTLPGKEVFEDGVMVKLEVVPEEPKTCYGVVAHNDECRNAVLAVYANKADAEGFVQNANKTIGQTNFDNYTVEEWNLE